MWMVLSMTPTVLDCLLFVTKDLAVEINVKFLCICCQCSATCGPGTQQRKVTCRTKDMETNREISDSKCEPKHKPEESRSCNLGACDSMEQFDWLLSPWGPVSNQSYSCVNNVLYLQHKTENCFEYMSPVSQINSYVKYLCVSWYHI